MKFDHSVQVGASFGLTSGVITTLGLVVGLAAGTQSRLAVVGGILTIAIADSLSDALGIHVSEELENVHTPSEIWVSTASTFAVKFVTALSFLVPVLTLDLGAAVVASVAWGMLLLASLSLYAARLQKVKAWPVLAEHLAVAGLVVSSTHFLGRWVSSWLG